MHDMGAPMTSTATDRAAAAREPAIIPAIVQQHAEEAAMLRHIRSVLVRAPHVGLLHLGRFFFGRTARNQREK